MTYILMLMRNITDICINKKKYPSHMYINERKIPNICINIDRNMVDPLKTFIHLMYVERV
jgi:hypothetical protein